MEQETDSLTNRLRAQLQPQGTAPIVFVKTRGLGLVLDSEFVNKCIDELDRVNLSAVLGIQSPSNLEKLAFMLLCNSAYIDLTKEPK